MINERTNLREWYMATYPDDEVGKTLNEETTFYDIFYALDNYQDVYDVIGGDSDSLVRERVFEQLAIIMNTDYEEIYEQWLKGA